MSLFKSIKIDKGTTLELACSRAYRGVYYLAIIGLILQLLAFSKKENQGMEMKVLC